MSDSPGPRPHQQFDIVPVFCGRHSAERVQRLSHSNSHLHLQETAPIFSHAYWPFILITSSPGERNAGSVFLSMLYLDFYGFPDNRCWGPAWWRSGSVCVLRFSSPGLAGLDPGPGPTHRSSNHSVAASHRQSRGRWAQLLAQGLSSSSEKRKLGNSCWLGATLPHPKERKKDRQKRKQSIQIHVESFHPLFCSTGILVRLYVKTIRF